MISAMIFDVRDEKSIQIYNVVGWFISVLVILYIGLRPIHPVFIDMATYAKAYSKMQQGDAVIIEKDYVFNYFMKWCSTIMPAKQFFFLIAILYILPCIAFSRKYFGKYWFFAMIMFLGSFSFWTYGVNGLRNGLGTAIFILGLVYYNSKKTTMYIFFTIAFFTHASIIIPFAAFIASGVYKNPKAYIFIWLAAIPLSLIGGGVWIALFSKLGFAEDRTSGYLVGGDEYMSKFSKTGFRWDFLLYSASAVFAGWYFIFKKHIIDNFYIQLFGVYCIANAFWILVISAAFSNRFAYLSWFLMPAVIAYPMFRYKIWKDQYKTFAIILLLYFAFTFYMNVRF